MISFFTIIIPLYNSNYIDIQIKSINSLVINNIDLEILFIDDGSDLYFIDEYKKYFLNISNKIRFKYIELREKKGQNRVCLARNRGVEESSNNNLIFIDQDTILHKNYLLDLLLLINKKIILGQSLGYNSEEKTISRKDIDFFINNGYINKKNFSDFRVNFSDLNNLWKILGASNLFIKKDIFNKISGFDENSTNWGDEDVEFGFRLKKLGFNIYFEDKLKVLNISEKLYNFPYLIMEDKNINTLTKNFLFNYNKHLKSEKYKDYILDRFSHFKYNQKILSNNDFKEKILFNNFYSENRKNVVLFRLDDINELTENFKYLMKIFIKYNIPIVLAVEPGNINKEIIIYLNYIKDKYPNLIDITQHGYKHINYSTITLKYEFGINRSYNNQFLDIKKGYDIMNEKFGNNFLNCFVPPYNNIDENTEKVIKKIGYDIFSSGYPYINFLGKNKILSIPSYLDIIDDYNNLTYKTESDIYFEIDYYLNRDGYIGIILHPQFFDKSTFTLLIKIFEYLKSKDYDFQNFSDFYKLYKLN